jgi:c-di-GMP-binding flagellar brake protein YcgR
MLHAGKGWLEKRKHTRIEAALNITYVAMAQEQGPGLEAETAYAKTRLEDLTKSYFASPLMHAMTENISEGGLSLVADEGMPLGSYLVVDIHLPRMGSSIRVLAKVVRLDNAVAIDTTTSARRMGLTLLAFHKDGLNRLQGLILKRMHVPQAGWPMKAAA